MTFVTFVFADLYHFVGVIILLVVTGEMLEQIVRAARK